MQEALGLARTKWTMRQIGLFLTDDILLQLLVNFDAKEPPRPFLVIKNSSVSLF